MKKAIVTGSNGFLGCALCKQLSQQGVEIIAIVRDKEEDISEIQFLSGLRIIYCDLSEFIILPDLIPDRDVDVFFHLAWIGSAGLLRSNDDIQIKNIRYTCDTVKACYALRCKRFVFSASLMEYEIHALMDSDKTPGINTLYCSAKLAADYFARTLAGSMNIAFLCAMITNIYGPGEISPRLINNSLRKMLAGEHCSFSAGDQIYDFIYITDAAKAFVAIGEKGLSNRVYYIGSLSPHPLKEFLCQMRDQVDPHIEIGLGEIPFNGVQLNYREFDIEALKRDTGFEPSVDFINGIRHTIAWLRGNGHG